VSHGHFRRLAAIAVAAVLLASTTASGATPAKKSHRRSVSTSAPAPAAASLAPFPAALASAARGAPAASRGVSVVVSNLDDGSVVFQKNPDQPETIASVTKMFSSAAALHYLGSDYKFKTTLWRKGEIHDGTLIGSLLVVGGGDPNISGRFHEDDSFAIFDSWVQGLAKLGVVRIQGDLVLNASAFDGMYRHPEWPPDRDSRWYQAPISALSYNDNVVIVSVGRGAIPGAPASVAINPDTDVVQALARARTVGKAGKIRVAVSRPSGSELVTVSGTVPSRYFRWSVPLAIDDPPKFFGAALKSRLRAAGIDLVGNVVEQPTRPDGQWILVASTESELLPTLAISNKRSQSFYAEQIFKTVAYERTGRGTWDAAVQLGREFLAGIGLDPNRYELHDGSGLSAYNRVSAGALVDFLKTMNAQPHGAEWRATLAVSGEADGSLRHRLLDDSSRGEIQAKTGTLNGVSTLAGYAKAASGKTYAFAILLNGPGVSESRGHAYQDRIVRTIVRKG
jgi:D-alanyl-D-alanine carboxypeptidase/D-alanyl-D-alanine-endopeptidase (penicillin-binding protein 4)